MYTTFNTLLNLEHSCKCHCSELKLLADSDPVLLITVTLIICFLSVKFANTIHMYTLSHHWSNYMAFCNTNLHNVPSHTVLHYCGKTNKDTNS